MKKFSYNNKGPVKETERGTEQLLFKDLQCFFYPANCMQCPIGFQKRDCGRNYPLTEKDMICRPKTCKLKLVE